VAQETDQKTAPFVVVDAAKPMRTAIIPRGTLH
jgi:hypothetical protein